MIAHPLVTLVWASACEDVKPRLKPGRPALRDLYCLVFLMIGGQRSIRGCGGTFRRKVAVQLHHGAARRYRLGTIHLHFIVALPVRLQPQTEKASNGKKRLAHQHLLWRYESFADRKQNQFGRSMDVHFLHQIGAMNRDRIDA